MFNDGLKILFISSEAVPFAKTGGLADVAGTLPVALKNTGADVRLVIPLYRVILEKKFELQLILKNLKVPLGNEDLSADIYESVTGEGLPVYLVGREDLYGRPDLYGNSAGDYYDNLERYSFFSHAALKIAEALSFKPDLIHCHDWQTGLVPALISDTHSKSPGLSGPATVFTIHNVGYQGLFPMEKLPITGLSPQKYFHMNGLEFWGKISLLKSGVNYADAITTVSPSYALEIQTPEYGMGMEGVFRQKKDVLYGILNGVDYQTWNPEKDPLIPKNYSMRDLKGKKACKASLIDEMGLDPSLRDKPLFGIISRLDPQKGFDLLKKILGRILAMNCGVLVLGSGDESIRNAIRSAADSHPGRVAIKFGFDEHLAHRIIAGTDILLIPSKYEPCGLTQMYALKYGTVPVVRATGGLDDTVVSFNSRSEKGNGFKFGAYKSTAFLKAIRRAVDQFRDKDVWNIIMSNGMKEDFSWNRSAESYMSLYKSLVKRSR